MGNLNRRNIINDAEEILAKCEEKYKEDGNSKRKVRELERKCRKLKKYNLIWKALLISAIICIVVMIIK